MYVVLLQHLCEICKEVIFEIALSVMTSKPLVPKVLNLHDNQLVFSNKDYQVVAIVYNKSHGR
jgi:hypothetical protein